MTQAGDRIGIIAGSGHLPLHVAKCLSDAGRDFYVAGLQGAADPSLENPRWKTGWYDTHALKELLEGLEKERVTKVVLAGRVGHDQIYRTREFDDTLRNFLASLDDHRPATVLGGLVELLGDHGFPVLPLTEVAPDLLRKPGLLAGPPVQDGILPDIRLGWRIARALADQDIGQTAVVKDGAVVAVEAMEGTDKTIERAGTLSPGGLTVVKRAAAGHDFRYDVPTVGPDTILSLDHAGGGIVTIEAGRSFVLDFDRMATLCDDKGITLISGSGTEDGMVHWHQT